MKGQRIFIRHIISESVLMLYMYAKSIKFSLCFSKLQLAMVGTFFEIQCMLIVVYPLIFYLGDIHLK